MDAEKKFAIYNETFFGTFFNFVLGIVRILVYFPSVYNLVGSISFLLSSTFNDFKVLNLYLSVVQIVVLVVIVYDCTTSRGILFGFGDYYDRMRLSRLSHWMGLGGHIGLACLRFMLWSVVLVGQLLDRMDPTTFVKVIDSIPTAPDKEYLQKYIHKLFQIECLYFAMALYSILAFFAFVSSFISKKTLEHPWTGSYVPDPKTRRIKSFMDFFSVAALIINTTYMCYVVIRSMFFQRLFPDQWEIEFEEVFVYFLCLSLLIVCTLRTGYLLLRNLRGREVSSSFILVFWYFSYILCVVDFYSRDYVSESRSYSSLYYTAFVFLLNFIYLFTRHIIPSLNNVGYCIGIVFSRAFANTLFGLIILNTLIMSGTMAYMVSGQNWFDSVFTPADFMNLLLDIVEELYKILRSVMRIIVIIANLVSEAFGVAVCVILVAAIILAIALMIIPFGIGSFGWFIKKVVEFAKNVMKILMKVKNLRTALLNFIKFVNKVKEFLIAFTAFQNALVRFGFLAFLAYSIPSMIAISAVLVNFWERKAVVNRFSFLVFGVFLSQMLLISFLLLLMLKFIIARNFNFIIFEIRFFATPAFYFTVYAHIFAMISVFYYFLLVVFGGPKKQNYGLEDLKPICCKFKAKEKKVETKESSNILEIPEEKHSYLYKENISEQSSSEEEAIFYRNYVDYSTSLAWDLLRKIRSIICFRKYRNRESFCELSKKIFQKIFHCFYKNTEPRNLCPYQCTFPCDHEDDDEDLFRRNRPLNCCYLCECEVDCNENTVCSKLFNFGNISNVALFTVPFSLCALALYFFIRSLSMEWLEFVAETDSEVQRFIFNLSPFAFNNAIDGQNEEKSLVCPFIDVAAIISVLLSVFGGIFGFLFDILKKFKLFFELFRFLREIINAIKGLRGIFNFAFKLLMVAPGIISAILVYWLGTMSTLIKYLRNEHIVLLTSVLLLPGFVQLLVVPNLIGTFLEMIPFLEFEAVFYQGFYFANYGYYLMVIVLLMLIVDGISKPKAPVKPYNLEDQFLQIDEDVVNPTHLNEYVNVVGSFRGNNELYDFEDEDFEK